MTAGQHNDRSDAPRSAAAAQSPRSKPTVSDTEDDHQTRKRRRVATDETDALPPPSDRDARTETYPQKLAALNASFVASVDAQLCRDPASDLTALVREYEAAVRELRAEFAPAQLVADALSALEDELDQAQDDVEPTTESISFVASSDVAEMGEREREEDEVYFGASLDLNALSSSSRQIQFSRQDSNGEGFLASEASLGTSGIWEDPGLQCVRVPSAEIQTHGLVCSNAHSENWQGTCVQTPVMVKRLSAGARTMANAVAFAQHILGIAPLQHPNLVAIVGIAWDKAVDIQAATEFVPRGDLQSLFGTTAAAALSWPQGKCQIAVNIADANAYVHSQLQRAIPSQVTSRKVLIDASGTAQLQLLQLATICGAEETLIPWTAPEVLTGQPRSPLSDIYTLGVLLCELDTARPAFAEAVNPDGSKMALAVVAQRVARGELTPMLTDACPPEITALVRQCLTTDPTQRPTAVRVAYALREILKNDL